MCNTNAKMHEIVKVRYHLCRQLGLAEVLIPADCVCLNPSSIRSSWAVCSSIYLRSNVCPLKIFFMSFQMKDMKERSICGRWLASEIGFVLLLHLFLRRGISWCLLRYNSWCPYWVEATVVRTRDPLKSHEDLVIWRKFLIWQKISAQTGNKKWVWILRASSVFGVGN